MGSAIVPLQNITLGSAATSVTFASIPGTFRDLRIVINAKNTVDAQGIRTQYTDDANANYSYIVTYGTGSGNGASGAGSGLTYADYGVNRTSNQTTLVDIMDYSATDKHKTALVRSDNATAIVLYYLNRWASNSAITKVKLSASANSFAAGSTFSLYGVKS